MRTTEFIPDCLPILARGKQFPGNGKLCAEQFVDWLVSGGENLGNHTDRPKCVNPFLNDLSIIVNDSLSDSTRPYMIPLLLNQPGTAYPELEPYLGVRLYMWIIKHLQYFNPNVSPIFLGAFFRRVDNWLALPTYENFIPLLEWMNTYSPPVVFRDAKYGPSLPTVAEDCSHLIVNFLNNLHLINMTNLTYSEQLDLLAAAQVEHARLTGYVPSPPVPGRLERACELLGSISSV